jgi:eukaryotic-like serine/threonine-protein kinase
VERGPLALSDLRPGDAVADGRVVIRRLGGGRRYEAWLGWDDHLAAPVVIKVLRAAHADDGRARTAIAREGAHLAHLAHPVIVRSFDADLDGPRPYLVLELLDGPRLSTLVRRYGPLSPEQLVPLAMEISSALSYLHNEQVVHLDVKPQNLIMGAPPRLIDLSIARRFEDVPKLRGPIGTDAYMAPEQCREEDLARIGPASDVWGLGATLYEAANAFRPFPKRETGGPHPQLTVAPRAFHPRVPAVLRELIVACLRVEPDARPSLDDLMGAFDELAPEAHEVAIRRLRRRMR